MHCSIPFLVVRYKLPLTNYSYLCNIVAKISIMFEPLKDYCLRILPFTDEELRAVDEHFVERIFKRKELLLEAPRTCRHLFFIVKGSIRYFRIKEDGSETTCDISLDNQWATEFVSFTSGAPVCRCRRWKRPPCTVSTRLICMPCTRLSPDTRPSVD